MCISMGALFGGVRPYAQCNMSSGSPRKKEYITMDARIVVANMHM